MKRLPQAPASFFRGVLVLGMLLRPACSHYHLRFNARLSVSAMETIRRDQSQQEMSTEYQQLLAIAIIENIVNLDGAPYAPTIRDAGLHFAAIVWPYTIRQDFEEALDFVQPEQLRGNQPGVVRGAVSFNRCSWHQVLVDHELGHPCPAGNSMHVISQTGAGVWMHSMIFYQAHGFDYGAGVLSQWTSEYKVEFFKEKAWECADGQPRLRDINSRVKIDLNALALCLYTSTSLILRNANQPVFRGSAVVPSYAAANEERTYGMYNRDGCLLMDHHQVDVYLTGRRVFGADIPRRMTITLWFFSAPGRQG